jgi:hypothetical protein
LPKENDPANPSSPSNQVSYITDYNLQSYVPVPVAGKQPVKQVGNRANIDVRVVWKNNSGKDITESLAKFENGLVYQAEITLTANEGYEFRPDKGFAYPAGNAPTGNNSHASSLSHLWIFCA